MEQRKLVGLIILGVAALVGILGFGLQASGASGAEVLLFPFWLVYNPIVLAVLLILMFRRGHQQQQQQVVVMVSPGGPPAPPPGPQVRCAACRQLSAGNAAFCGHCGAPIGAAARRPAAPPAARR